MIQLTIDLEQRIDYDKARRIYYAITDALDKQGAAYAAYLRDVPEPRAPAVIASKNTLPWID